MIYLSLKFESWNIIIILSFYNAIELLAIQRCIYKSTRELLISSFGSRSYTENGVSTIQASTPASYQISKLEALPDELIQNILHYCLLLPEVPCIIHQEQKVDYGKGLRLAVNFQLAP